MTYNFKDAKDSIRDSIKALEDDDENSVFQNVVTGKKGKISTYKGRTVIFGLGDGTKSTQPIGERGTITREGTMIILHPGQSEAAEDSVEEAISLVLDLFGDGWTLQEKGFTVEHARNNLIRKRTFNLTPKLSNPTLYAGAMMWFDVTIPNLKKQTPEPEPEP